MNEERYSAASAAASMQAADSHMVDAESENRHDNQDQTAAASCSDAAPRPTDFCARLKAAARRIKMQIIVLYFAAHDPELGWLPKAVAAVAVAYALSPLDLVPDFIPVLGILDDLLILPGLIWLAVWLAPATVLERARRRAEAEPLRLGRHYPAAICIFLVWDACLIVVLYFCFTRMGGRWLRRHWLVVAAPATAAVALVEAVWLVAEVRKHRAGGSAATISAATGAPAEEPLLDGDRAPAEQV